MGTLVIAKRVEVSTPDEATAELTFRTHLT